MFKHCITLLSLVSLLIGATDNITITTVSGGGLEKERPPTGMQCISEEEREYVREHMLQLDQQSQRDTVLFLNPMGNDEMISDSTHLGFYIDENPNIGWIVDYSCNWVTYDGHMGTDIGIRSFYHMDEMTRPILAAAPGIVTYTHDGEFDRWAYWNYSAVANGVVISHSDGTSTWYWHMKKNTVAVAVGDTVVVGDTLGFVGSSGISGGPHLHFEVQNESGSVIDPWQGECSSGASRWVEQIPFVGDTNYYPSRVIRHITTAYPVQNNDDANYILSENIPSVKHINPGEDYLSWLFVRNLYATDTLRWEWYRDGEFFNDFWWIPGQSDWWVPGAELYTGSQWNIQGIWVEGDDALGEWTEKLFINSELQGEKTFICDENSNLSPSVDFQQIDVELGETVTGVFTATDDGDPFWFNLVNEPNNGGSVELYGGRRRKFKYTAPMDFTGYDVAGISATDDQGETGGMTFIIFDVYGTGLTNLLVEPSYVSLNQDSVFISADLMGESEGVSIRAHILDEMSNEVTMQDLVADGDNWSTSWAPQSESFFRVDLELVNGTENDTTFYDDIGSFTSVGPLTVSMDGETTVNPGGAAVLSFVVENYSVDQGVEDVSVSFEAGSMDCIEGISEDLFYLGDIDPSGTLSSGGNFFVASLNYDCNSDSTILINAHIYSGEDLYWVDNFTIQIETLGIGDDNVPAFYSLSEAYPNPFNPDTRIKYGLTQDGYVSFMVHDLMGRKVKSLVSLEKDAGYHSIRWDATNDFGESVSAGMYFYTIQAGEFRQTKKMILLK